MSHENTLQDVFIMPGILNDAALQQIHFLLHQADFSDGRATATDAAWTVKKNLQAPVENHAVLPSIQQLLYQTLLQYPLFHTVFSRCACIPFYLQIIAGHGIFGQKYRPFSPQNLVFEFFFSINFLTI